MCAWRKWNLDTFRYEHRERSPPAEYLRMSYYERWLSALTELLVKKWLVTRAEIESGTPQAGSPKATPPVTADTVPTADRPRHSPRAGMSPVAPRFQAGQRVRARNINPIGHTRLPRYARGKIGHGRARPRRLCFPRHERAFPRREAAAPLLRAFHRPRAVGRAGRAARCRLCRSVGRPP